jgi:hypothetical protein
LFWNYRLLAFFIRSLVLFHVSTTLPNDSIDVKWPFQSFDLWNLVVVQLLQQIYFSYGIFKSSILNEIPAFSVRITNWFQSFSKIYSFFFTIFGKWPINKIF